MREREQADHDAASPLLGLLGLQGLEGAGIGGPREELVAVDEVEQRHRLAAQGVDDMMVVDHVAALAVRLRTPAGQGHHGGRAEEAIEAVVIQADPQLMADQPRGHRIEDLAQGEAARRRDADEHFLVIRRPTRRQPVQNCPFLIDSLGVTGIAAADDLVDEATPGRQVVEIARAAQQQGVLDRPLEMAMGAFDRPVLMRDAGIVAGGCHPIMSTEILVAAS